MNIEFLKITSPLDVSNNFLNRGVRLGISNNRRVYIPRWNPLIATVSGDFFDAVHKQVTKQYNFNSGNVEDYLFVIKRPDWLVTGCWIEKFETVQNFEYPYLELEIGYKNGYCRRREIP